MRLTPRLGLRLVLVVIAIAIICMRLAPRFRPARGVPVGTTSHITDASALNQPGGGPAPAEAYAVYSALYQDGSQTAANDPLAFASTSQTDIPQVGASCLKPSTPGERELAEAFTAANQQSHEWEQKFTIPQGYRLLSIADADQAKACLQAHDQTSAQCAAYKQIRHVRFLGVLGLDRTQTHALVSVIKSCGGFCGSGGIFEVEKSGTTWQRSPSTDFTRDCSWAY